MNFLRVSFGLFIASLLVACGGGGSASMSPSKLEGFYNGSVSTGAQVELLALENDQIYALIGTTVAPNEYRINSFVEGAGTSANGSFSIANAKEYAASGQVNAGVISGSFSPRSSVMGNLSTAAGTASFTATALSPSLYSYDAPTPIASIAGDWSGFVLGNDTVKFSITSSGAITGKSASGCTFTGLTTPRANGKNVLDANLVFGAVPCVQPGVAANGVAFSTLTNNGQRKLVFVVNNTARTFGTVFFAQR